MYVLSTHTQDKKKKQQNQSACENRDKKGVQFMYSFIQCHTHEQQFTSYIAYCVQSSPPVTMGFRDIGM